MRRILDEEDSFRNLADDFTALTRLRGTLMEERRGMYRFVHLALQEFLAARYLAEVVLRKEGVQGLVLNLEKELLSDSWWREPILLLIGYLEIISPQILTSLTNYLIGVERPQDLPPPPDQILWNAAALVGAAIQESFIKTENLSPLVSQIGNIFTNKVSIESVPPSIRAEVGLVLSRLGDPRLEVIEAGSMQFCYVPPGDFWNRTLDCVDYGYWLARYPVSNAQYLEFVEDGGYENDRYWAEAISDGLWINGKFQAIHHDRPRDLDPWNWELNYSISTITWYEAQAFVRWLNDCFRYSLPVNLHLQLPTSQEWTKAARGGIYILKHPVMWTVGAGSPPEVSEKLKVRNPIPERNFPWGDDEDTNRANGGDTDIPLEMDGPITIGCFPNGASPYGCEEMAGNVFEWTRSSHPSSHGDRKYAVMGAAHWYGKANVTCDCLYWSFPSLYESDRLDHGFRVCVSPKD